MIRRAVYIWMVRLIPTADVDLQNYSEQACKTAHGLAKRLPRLHRKLALLVRHLLLPLHMMHGSNASKKVK